MACVEYGGNIVSELAELQKRNPEREAVGYFTVEKKDAGVLVTEYSVVAFGDDDRVAFREFREYPFHTHPVNLHGMPEPPSGEDFMQCLSWGYPEFNPDMKSSAGEVVVSSEGLWHYRASEALVRLYFDLQRTDEQQQNLLAKTMCRYLTAVTTIYKNSMISLEKLFDLTGTLQFGWLETVLQKNPSFLKYLTAEFPLESLHKLAEGAGFEDTPGFHLCFSAACALE